MSAYAISEVEMRDAADFESYRSIAAKTIAKYGGRYLVRGGPASLIEGSPPPKTIIVVEFPTMERLREWYVSPEYDEALKLRQTALDRRLIFVQGVAPV
ncbi:DUF1330 domain-containing protein [Bradyrhizobium sp. RDI18]|uniref:DUF1330 domain-containing protein n=1 Tax=Bradyrhizobium sp. RDI18 TaxID=3367400 RepID=UPI003721AED6